MIKISIIIPVYNTEKYLKKCLDSIINQTLKSLEIICIDDCSTDNSLNILKEYQLKDNRIKIIEQKENKGQGVARNLGLNIAEGEYIGFIDSDDWIDLNFFEKLYFAAKKYNSDVALAANVRIGNGRTKKRLDFKNEEIYTNIEDKFNISKLLKNPCPTNKIYRREFLIKNNIIWPAGCYCEDKLFVTKAVYYANSLVCVPDIYYYYYRNPNSTVNTRTKKHLIKLKHDKNLAKCAVISFLKEKKLKFADKKYWADKKEFKFFGVTLFKIKSSVYSEILFLFGVIPLFKVRGQI